MTYTLHRTPVRSFFRFSVGGELVSEAFLEARTDCTEFPDAEAEE
jgi:hypothetical protein